MADTLVPGGMLMRICPKRLHRWVSLCETAVYSWLDDRAPTMGAAIAYYTVFSLAPMLVMVIAIAGLAFGQKAAEGALFDGLADLVSPESAGAVQAMPRSASSTSDGSRWEHEHVLEFVQRRLDEHPEKMRQRRETVEHPFGTLTPQ